MNSNTFTVENDPSSKYIYLTPTGEHQTTLIFLHGLGDSAEGFSDLFMNWNQHHLTPATTRVVLPTAPRSPVSCNNGYVMNSWFDIFSLSGTVPETLADIRKEYSQEQLMASANLVLKIVEEEKERFPDKDISRIYIGGFS